MDPIGTYTVLLLTGVITFLAFQDAQLFERLCFRPDRILASREFDRIITSAFLHADWVHFLFNAISFYSFARMIELIYGIESLLIIYFASIIGGNLLALYFHRNHHYRAVGASGGVCGVIFASIFLLPGTEIMLFFIPIGIPAWLFAILFLVGSFYGMRAQADNIGHDAHFGGAIVGMVTAAILFPPIIVAQPLLFSAALLGSAGMIAYLLRNPFNTSAPSIRLEKPSCQNQPPSNTRYQRYDEARENARKRAEVDRILEKINEKGFDSLNEKEKTLLEEHSRRK